MPSLYAQYIKEREDIETIEDEFGFITYKVVGEELLIKEIYVVPEHRMSFATVKLAREITDIAKIFNCKYLSCTVCPSALNATKSLKAILSYGFKLIRNHGDLIVLAKEIK